MPRMFSPRKPLVVRLRDGVRQTAARQHQLAAAVDEHGPDPQRVRGDDHPLDELVRVLLHQLAVVEGARLRLVRVADQVVGPRGVGSLGMKPHFMPVGAPAPPRPRSPDALTISMSSSGCISQQRLLAAAVVRRAPSPCRSGIWSGSSTHLRSMRTSGMVAFSNSDFPSGGLGGANRAPAAQPCVQDGCNRVVDVFTRLGRLRSSAGRSAARTARR